MSQQVMVIGGGTTFDNYKDYLSYLKNHEISLDRLKFQKDWKNTLAEKLGNNFEVFTPRMPNVTNAHYSEWKIWFERITAFLNESVILIGHSLGGIFLAKYLSENVYPKAIKATILVATPFDDQDREESLADFKLPSSLTKFAKQGGDIYLIHSKDDSVVQLEQIEKYKEALPDAKVIILDDRGHFVEESFPEIIELIKDIS